MSREGSSFLVLSPHLTLSLVVSCKRHDSHLIYLLFEAPSTQVVLFHIRPSIEEGRLETASSLQNSSVQEEELKLLKLHSSKKDSDPPWNFFFFLLSVPYCTGVLSFQISSLPPATHIPHQSLKVSK